MVDLKARPFYLDEGKAAWVRDTLTAMTEEEKLGQLFCVMGGDFSPERLEDMVLTGRVGSVLFRPAPATRIRACYAPLDEAARIPLLKAANLEEGGSGAATDGTLYGFPMLVAAAGDAEEAERFGAVCAAEGRSVGVNWSFSPVSDLDLNPLNPITNVRSFGSDLNTVLSCTSAYVRALQTRGVAACAKHFPGDGVDYRDQHLHPSYNSLSAADWFSSYGKVYENLIENDLLSVMVGHICQPAVSMEINPSLRFEDCLPGSLSRELLTGVLRERFGFNGVITTDATIMGGFTMAMARRDALPAAIMAGCDMLVDIVGLFLANFFMGILGFCGIRLFSKIGDVDTKYLTPIVFVFCIVGTFALNNSVKDIFLMLIVGTLAFFLIKLDFPMPPVILGLILGDTLEKNLQRSLIRSGGSLRVFIQRPISLTLLIIAFASIFLLAIIQLVKKLIRRKS